MKTRILFVLCLLLLISACSTLPRRVHPLQKNTADQILGMAQGKELIRRYEDAVIMYDNALGQYYDFADLDGILQSLAGKARIDMELGDTDSYETNYLRMQDLITKIDKEKIYHLQLLDMHRAYRRGDWDYLSQKPDIQKFYPRLAKLQIYSYYVQARAFTKKPDQKAVKELHRLYRRSLSRIRGDNTPQLVSLAAYSLAYHYYTLAEIPKANRYLKVASRIDYANSLFSALGYDLWLSAQIHLQQGNVQRAGTDLQRARLIFINEQNDDMLRRIDNQFKTLQGR